DQLALWQQQALLSNQKLPLILHVDTGMNRLGFEWQEFALLREQKEMLACFDLLFGMSHLACAEDVDSGYSEQQLRRCKLLQTFFPSFCLANSTGIFLGTRYHFNYVRPGCALYGLNPLPKHENPMQQVVTLHVPILHIRTIGELNAIGYHHSYMAKGGDKIAILPIGYADGYLRVLSNKAHVMVQGMLAPIVGKISMDLMMVDVSHLPEKLAHPGAMIEIIGKHCTIDMLAKQAGTINYEILVRLGNRFSRHYY
ncbi:MAG: alanine racemase, partial [Burkholderiales bacterium]